MWALEQQEEQVAGEGRGAQGQTEDGRQRIGQGGDGGGAQMGLCDQGDAQGVEEQRDRKARIAFDDIRSFHDGPLARGMPGKHEPPFPGRLPGTVCWSVV